MMNPLLDVYRGIISTPVQSTNLSEPSSTSDVAQQTQHNNKLQYSNELITRLQGESV